MSDEHYAPLVAHKEWFDPPMQRLVDFCATKSFGQRAKAWGDDDTSAVRTVLGNA